MTDTGVHKNDMSTKQVAIDWLLHQGASTVLLVLILVGAYIQVPSLSKHVTNSFERIELLHNAELKDARLETQNSQVEFRKAINDLEQTSRDNTTRIVDRLDAIKN